MVKSVKQTNLYPKVLKELNYSFADVFIFDGFIISEIKQGVNFSWNNHAKYIVDDITCFLGTDGTELIYISNRIHSYSVVAIDWLKFFKQQYGLKGYYVVSNSQMSKLNLLVEQLFFKEKIMHFDSLFSAVHWVRTESLEIA
ncbi:hypothetical protein [Algibacter mikhailovii]|uniref:STAS/SEC14 domain-containing protein n=1 Tax=Algibacter mikhailovii TaxID=425498 RepID=A0A918V896_9FLAO|nr:hypothetical protein [Algibacter mikhailovii]GGZ80880.1 hypothetical protein GCM10007028_17810 [Algibacter mikhailovii]